VIGWGVERGEYATCALILSSVSAGKKTIPNEEAWGKFVGEWVNLEYPGIDSPSDGWYFIYYRK
jgi:hypothetical protein